MNTKLTKLEQTVFADINRGSSFSDLAIQLNRPLSAITAAHARAEEKIALRDACSARPPIFSTEHRLLSSIDVQRRFGGYLAVLIFTDGRQEATSADVVQTAQAALKRAEEHIAKPAHNIKWWTSV